MTPEQREMVRALADPVFRPLLHQELSTAIAAAWDELCDRLALDMPESERPAIVSLMTELALQKIDRDARAA